MKNRSPRLIAGSVLVVASLAVPSVAAAAPVTVNLRIEGPSSTLYQGNVTSDIRRFQFTGDAVTHLCDGTSGAPGTPGTPAEGPGGPGTMPVNTAGQAIATAIDSGLDARGSWSGFGASFSTISGVSVAYNGATGQYLQEFRNGVSTDYGACGQKVGAGDRVLLAYSSFGETPLRLTGTPATIDLGTAFGVMVANEGPSGMPQDGATVNGVTTAGGGLATIQPTSVGDVAIQASKAGFVRSNTQVVCVHNGNDGNCGTVAGGGGGSSTAPPATPTPETPTAPSTSPGPPAPPAPVLDRTGPIAAITGIVEGQTFAPGMGPQTLRGTVAGTARRQAGTGPTGIASVKIRLTRQIGKRCAGYSKSARRFRRAACKPGSGSFFGVSKASTWRYRLAARLGRGGYTLEVKATDRAGKRGPVRRLRFRVR